MAGFLWRQQKMVKKRKLLNPEEATNLRRCLSASNCVAQGAVRDIWNIASELRHDAGHAGKTVSVSLDAERLQPFWRCFAPVDLQMTDAEEKGENIFILQLKEALACVCNRSALWRAQVQAAAHQGGCLTPVLYSDEVHCGNILSGRPVKKITCWYMSFREFRESLHLESVWLPAAFAPVEFSERVQGGISAITARILLSTHIPPFAIVAPGMVVQVKMAPSTLYIADMDAQRLIYTSKGSAGLRPCLFCANLVARRTQTAVAGVVSLDEPSLTRCVQTLDADLLAAVDKLPDIVGVGARNEAETVYGLLHVPESVMARPEIRQMMPPCSNGCNDALHAYFCSGGIAQVEAHSIVKLLETHHWSVERICKQAIDDGWKCPGSRQTESKIKKLFAKTLHETDTFRGSARDCWSLIPLLHYYAFIALEEKPEAKPFLLSFSCLRKCCTALKEMKQRWTEITCTEHVAELDDLQRQHHIAFGLAYCNGYKPKHHHRLHLGQACLKLGFLPSVERQEAKHGLIKTRGLLDRQQGKLADFQGLQKAILPRMLADSVGEANQDAKLWGIAGKETPAPKAMCKKLGEPSLKQGTEAVLLQITVRKEEVIMWPKVDSAAVVCEIYGGSSTGPWLLLNLLQKECHTEWGSIWNKTGRKSLWKPQKEEEMFTPSWWTRVHDAWLILH